MAAVRCGVARRARSQVVDVPADSPGAGECAGDTEDSPALPGLSDGAPQHLADSHHDNALRRPAGARKPSNRAPQPPVSLRC